MNLLPVEFHPDAIAEAAEARRWYSNINLGLGDNFADEIDTAVARAAAGPERGGRHLHGTRVMLVERFPYFVVYRTFDVRIQVIAIQHARRQPGYWRHRIRPS